MRTAGIRAGESDLDQRKEIQRVLLSVLQESTATDSRVKRRDAELREWHHDVALFPFFVWEELDGREKTETVSVLRESERGDCVLPGGRIAAV